MKRNDHVVVFAINGMTPRQAARMTASTMVTVKKFQPVQSLPKTASIRC